MPDIFRPGSRDRTKLVDRGSQFVHTRRTCAHCGDTIYLRGVSAFGTDEWAHEDAFDERDRTRCHVDYPNLVAAPAD